jgi:hypothetical protein
MEKLFKTTSPYPKAEINNSRFVILFEPGIVLISTSIPLEDGTSICTCLTTKDSTMFNGMGIADGYALPND